MENIPEESTPEESTPEESTPEESTPEENIPEENIPEESTPEESTPEENIPEESTPEENPFDESYFDGGSQSTGYGSYTDSWIWSPMAEVILHLTSNKGPVLDWGCAKGHLVHKLVKRGIDTLGVDISEYAVSKAPPDIASRVQLINGIRFYRRDSLFETVLSFETLEHIPGDKIPLVVKEIHRLTKRWFFGTIFIEGQESHDPTHVSIHTREWWNSTFQEQAFRVREDIALEAMRYPVFQALKWQVFCFEKLGI